MATFAAHVGVLQAVDESGNAQATRFTPSHAPAHGPTPAQAARPPRDVPDTAEQTPWLPGTSHASHCSVHGESQHTPSTQNPPAHWAGVAHWDPGDRVGTQIPAAHHSPAGQSPSTVQFPAQIVAPQAKGAQDCCCSPGQDPAPVQNASSVATSAEHVDARHCTVPPGNVQLVRLVPSQAPPHVEPSLAHGARTPRGDPTTGVHVPSAPATSHASHWPVHAVSQQKPSMHTLETHCVAVEQGEPLGRRSWQVPAEQNCVIAQSPSTEQPPPHSVPVQENGAQSWVC